MADNSSQLLFLLHSFDSLDIKRLAERVHFCHDYLSLISNCLSGQAIEIQFLLLAVRPNIVFDTMIFKSNVRLIVLFRQNWNSMDETRKNHRQNYKVWCYMNKNVNYT